MNKMKKRVPFVVGVVHHKLYSPGTKDIPKVKKRPTTPKRVTRVTLKRLMLKTQQTKQVSRQDSKKKEEQELLFERVDPHSMTSSVVSKFVLPSSRLTRASTNSSTTKFTKEEIALATINKRDDNNSSEKSSNDATISDKDSNEEKKEKNDESLNNNITEPNKQFNNSIKEVDNNTKSALSSSKYYYLPYFLLLLLIQFAICIIKVYIMSVI